MVICEDVHRKCYKSTLLFSFRAVRPLDQQFMFWFSYRAGSFNNLNVRVVAYNRPS